MSSTASSEVPIGAILDFWTNPESTTPLPIPGGYVVCNGGTVSDPNSPLQGQQIPDLNNLFVRGVVDSSAVGNTGGATTSALPATTGSCAESGDNPGNQKYKARDDNQGWSSDVHLRVDGGSSKDEGQHRHDLGGSISILPPYFTLIKIMRIV